MSQSLILSDHSRLARPNRLTVRRKPITAVSRRKRVHPALWAAIEVLETRRLLATLAYTGTIQTYTVPTTGIYNVTLAGAQGGTGFIDGAGGDGEVLWGQVTLTAGTTLQVVVGGEGANTVNTITGGAGGGGSFVYVTGQPEPIAAAGGGGDFS